MSEAEREAAELLPCQWISRGDWCTPDSHPSICPAHYRPAVAGALRKAANPDMHAQLVERYKNDQTVRCELIDYLRAQLATAQAEIADLIADVEKRGETIVNQDAEIVRLRTQLNQSNSDWPMRRRS